MATITTTAVDTRYKVYIFTADKTRLDVTDAIVSLDISEQEKQMAVSVTIDLYNARADGKMFTTLIAPANYVKITANDGQKTAEVFRGFIWDISPKSSLTDDGITIKCYDQLIYWQESEDAIFFTEGRDTKSILNEIAKNWGFTLQYDFESIVHEQLVLRGAIADFVTADILDTVKKAKGKKYFVRGEQGKIRIGHVGSNDTVYTISKKENATEVREYITMNGVVTQIIILGKANDDGVSPVEATQIGNTGKYGTLQKILTRSEDTDISKAKAEAKSIISDEGDPKWEYDVKAVDIPWIRKGDSVRIATDALKGQFVVIGINRDISNRGNFMTLTLSK